MGFAGELQRLLSSAIESVLVCVCLAASKCCKMGESYVINFACDGNEAEKTTNNNKWTELQQQQQQLLAIHQPTPLVNNNNNCIKAAFCLRGPFSGQRLWRGPLASNEAAAASKLEKLRNSSH